MGDTFVISGLRDKRAGIAGEIQKVENALKQRRVELAEIYSVIRMFPPDCNPDMIPPIQPAGRRALFFRYNELPRMLMAILRNAKGPLALNRIVDMVIEAKGLTETLDHRVLRHIRDCVCAKLMRMERRGVTRRLLDELDAWWELVVGQSVRPGRG